jgi:hypothetical protein
MEVLGVGGALHGATGIEGGKCGPQLGDSPWVLEYHESGGIWTVLAGVSLLTTPTH